MINRSAVSFTVPDTSGQDLEAVIDGVEFARSLSRRLGDLVTEEVLPGPQVRTRAEIADYVRNEAWGHHACGTCTIGTDDDPHAVLDGQFRVRGIDGGFDGVVWRQMFVNVDTTGGGG